MPQWPVCFVALRRVVAGKKVIGYARSVSSAAMFIPGTIVTRSRMIPGAGSTTTYIGSDKLRATMAAAAGVPAGDFPADHAAHHIIPGVLREHPVLKDIGMDLDDATNGVALASSHHGGFFGAHASYNQALKEAIDAVPSNLSVSDKMNRVYEIQAKIAEAFTHQNASLRGANATTFDQWKGILNANPWF